MNRHIKTTIVLAGAIVFSTLTIQASDIARGIRDNLGGKAADSTLPCGYDAVLIQFGDHAICMDTYETSAGPGCPFQNPGNVLDTRKNMNHAECAALSAPDRVPWRFVSLTAAQQLCARSGKRLPTNEEWYKAAAGIAPLHSCVIDNATAPLHTGTAACVTPAGVHDLIGNVWEWVDGEIRDGMFDGRRLPASGYVALVDSRGVVLETADAPNDAYGNDYAHTGGSGTLGMLRGGFYGSGDDAGVFAFNGSVPLDFHAAGVGFRCVRDF